MERPANGLGQFVGQYLGCAASQMVFTSGYLRGNEGACLGSPGNPKLGTLVIGDRFRLVSTVARSEIVTGPQGTISIGDGVYINYGCSISAQEMVKICSGVTIGTYCILMDNDFHSIDPVTP